MRHLAWLRTPRTPKSPEAHKMIWEAGPRHRGRYGHRPCLMILFTHLTDHMGSMNLLLASRRFVIPGEARGTNDVPVQPQIRAPTMDAVRRRWAVFLGQPTIKQSIGPRTEVPHPTIGSPSIAALLARYSASGTAFH